MTLGFRQTRHRAKFDADSSLLTFGVSAADPPQAPWIEFIGPTKDATLRASHHPDFASFHRLAASLVNRDDDELTRAMTIYRFCARLFHGASMGWGGMEMTRFVNCFGYSFCWGQADFQHLLYQAAGLQARAPQLPGHSSVEVRIAGQWRMMDAYMRLLMPSADLSGLATGAEASARREIFPLIRDPETAKNASDWWGTHGAGGYYEPRQDSSAMGLQLRREESLRFDRDRRSCWCMAPVEPADYCNGRWRWEPILDAVHLGEEVVSAVGVEAGQGGLAVGDASSTARVDYVMASPWPWVAGYLDVTSVEDAGIEEGGVSVQVFDSTLREWVDVAATPNEGARDAIPGRSVVRFDLSALMSPGETPASLNVAGSAYLPVYEMAIRLSWSAPTVLAGVTFEADVQAHRPSLPFPVTGDNAYELLASCKTSSVRVGWSESTGLALSNDRPYVGESILLQAAVQNDGAEEVDHARVRFVHRNTGETIGVQDVGPIGAGESVEVHQQWTAAIGPNRPPRGVDGALQYVDTVVAVEIEQGAGEGLADGGQCDEGDRDGDGKQSLLVSALERRLVVFASPRPRFGSALTWSKLDDAGLTLRAAVVHTQDDDAHRLVYLQPSRLSVTITPCLGDPDAGGEPLIALRQSLEGIEASEFAVANWQLADELMASIIASGEVWFLVESDSPIPAHYRRLTAKHVLADRRDGAAAATTRSATATGSANGTSIE